MAVVLDRTAANLVLPNGTLGWNGVGTRQFWIVPQQKMVIVMFVPSGKAAVIHRDIKAAVVGSIQR